MREPVEIEKRKRLTRAERDLILARQDNCCGGPCGKTLIWTMIGDTAVFGPMIDEHVLPLELGGSNDLTNRALYCVPCAKKKTAKQDIPAIAKAKRNERKADPLTRPKSKRPLTGRGFDKRFSRKLDGTVVSRDQPESKSNGCLSGSHP